MLLSATSAASSYTTHTSTWPSCEHKEVALLYTSSIAGSVQGFCLQVGCRFHHLNTSLKAIGYITLVPCSWTARASLCMGQRCCWQWWGWPERWLYRGPASKSFQVPATSSTELMGEFLTIRLSPWLCLYTEIHGYFQLVLKLWVVKKPRKSKKRTKNGEKKRGKERKW